MKEKSPSCTQRIFHSPTEVLACLQRYKVLPPTNSWTHCEPVIGTWGHGHLWVCVCVNIHVCACVCIKGNFPKKEMENHWHTWNLRLKTSHGRIFLQMKHLTICYSAPRVYVTNFSIVLNAFVCSQGWVSLNCCKKGNLSHFCLDHRDLWHSMIMLVSWK